MILLVVIQFINYYRTQLSYYIQDANHHAETVATGLYHDFADKDRKALSLQETEKRLQVLLQPVVNEHDVIRLSVSAFLPEIQKWVVLSDRENRFPEELSVKERALTDLYFQLLTDRGMTFYKGQGITANGYAERGNDFDTRFRVSIAVEANGFIRDQITAAISSGILFFAILLVLIIQYRLVFLRVYGSLEKIIQGMERVSGGTLDYKIPVYGNDQLVRINEIFNKMVDELKKSREGMEHKLHLSKEEKDRLFKVYRDVIYAITQGKLVLADKNEITGYIDEGALLAETTISKPDDVGNARKVAKRTVMEQFPRYGAINKLLLCISEAVTNVIKHAKAGSFKIRRLDNDVLRFVIDDEGPGMSYDKLPFMIFYKGFSTKESMGCGFKLIYSFVDRVILSTSNNGTILILEVNFQEIMESQK